LQRLNYILVRLLQMIPVAVGITIVLFFVMRAIPGDPAAIRLGIRATPEGIANLRHAMGLDKPIWIQYGIFLRDVVTLKLGQSISYGISAATLIGARLPVTLFLAVYATLFSILITVPAAVLAAIRKDRAADQLIRGGFMLVLGMPQFWLGVLFLMIFSLRLGLFPVSGYGKTFAEHLLHLFLPALTLSLAQAAMLVRTLRSDVIDVLRADYVDFARAKGLRERLVMTRHILRNALIPTVTLLGLNVGYLVGGTVVIERVFAIPGMGSLMLDAIFARDYVVVQAVTLCFAVLVILINLATDITYSFLDPRVTLG
jgi:peptide/nickel transport system permease protein